MNRTATDTARRSEGPSTGDGDQRGLIANTRSLFASRLAIAALGWAGTVLIVRQLDRAEFGQFTFVFSLLGMLSIVTDMGIGRIALRGVLSQTEDTADYAGTYVVLRSVLGVVGYAIALAVVVVAGYPAVVVQATALGGLVVLIATPSRAFDIAFQARMRLGRVAVAGVVGQAAQLALTVAIAIAGGSLLLFTLPAVLAEVVILGVKLPKARQLIDFHYVVRGDLWWAMAREAVPLSIGSALATIYVRVDAVMLSKLDGFDAVAVYGVAYKFVDLVHFASSALAVPILTLLVSAWPDDMQTFRRTMHRGAAFLAFIGGAVLVQFGLFADEAIDVLYGRDYVVGANATRILLLAEVLGFFTGLAFAAFVAAGRHAAYPVIMFVGLALNVALNAALIGPFSYRGAAVATLITEAVVVVLMWRRLLRLPGVTPLRLGRLGRIVPGAILASGAAWLIDAAGPWPVAAAVGLAVYVLAIETLRPAGPGGLRAILGDRE